MATMTFYHQERADGGRRTGLDVDGEAVLHSFAPGNDEESDPTLLWYVDVRISDAAPPTSHEEAAAWLARHADEIQAALSAAAGELGCGIDVDLLPWQFEYRAASEPILVSVSAMRRLAAREVGAKLQALATGYLPEFLATQSTVSPR
jgi:hypothetical protein